MIIEKKLFFTKISLNASDCIHVHEIKLYRQVHSILEAHPMYIYDLRTSQVCS